MSDKLALTDTNKLYKIGATNALSGTGKLTTQKNCLFAIPGVPPPHDTINI